FTDKAVLSTRKKRISFNKKAARQMIAQAQTLLGEAGEAHRRLEAIYTPAMDFSAVDALTDRLIQRLRAKKTPPPPPGGGGRRFSVRRLVVGGRRRCAGGGR
ncbi:MAG: hypothetical protein RR320_03685, partial [Oscillospiraceae bacterium]